MTEESRPGSPSVGEELPSASAPAGLELIFTDTLGATLEAIAQRIRDGAKTIRIEPAAAARNVIAALGNGLASSVRFVTAGEAPDVEQVSPATAVDLVAIASDDTETVSAALLTCLDLETGSVIAPITEHHSSRRCVFLISIPKAGTHLLYRLAESFGFQPGIICPPQPLPLHWYCVEYSNSHTTARDFFIDAVRRSPFGNKDHPFTRSPTLFIYRDPRDILVSEANWYHRPDASPLHGYLENLSFRERLLLLLQDPFLLGSIRDRVIAFAPWLGLPNVIPLSFEELIGEAGGGNANEQRRLIWSLQLKLQVSGTPAGFAADLFDRDSPTFNEGRIGSWRRYFDEEVATRFAELPQDFLQQFGYGNGGDDDILPMHRTKYRRRPLQVDKASFTNTPYLFESDVDGFNIVHFHQSYFAIPMTAGPVDLASLSEQELLSFPNDPDPDGLRAQLVLTREPANRGTVEHIVETNMQGNDLLSRLNALAERLDERDDRLQSLQTSLGELRQRIRSLERTIEERDQRIVSLEEINGERDHQIAAVSKGLAARDGRLRAFEERSAAEFARLDDLSDQQLERLAAIEREVRERERRSGRLDAASAIRDDRVAKLEESADRSSAQMAALQATCATLSLTVDEVGAVATETATRIEALANARTPQVETEAALAERDRRIGETIGELSGQLTQLEETIEERSGRLAQLEETVGERGGWLDQLVATLEERTGRLAALENGSAERLIRLNALEDINSGHTRLIDELIAVGSLRDERLGRVEEVADAVRSRLLTVESDLADSERRTTANLGECTSRLTGLELAAGERDALLSRLEAAAATVEVTVAGLDETLVERSNRLMHLEEAVEERGRRQGQLEETVAERTARLTQLAATVEERGSQLMQLFDTVEERDRRLGQLESTVEEHDRRLGQLEGTVEERDRRLEQLEGTVEERSRRLDQLGETLAERSDRLVAVENGWAESAARLAAMEDSRSGQASLMDQLITSAALSDSRLSRVETGQEALAIRLGGLETSCDQKVMALQVTVEHNVRELETSGAGTELRLGAIETTIGERDRRVSQCELALATTTANLAEINIELARVPGIASELAEVRDAVKKGLYATAMLEGSLQGLEEGLLGFRIRELGESSYSARDRV